jgi:DNA-binding Lrp family transcriptional regulator
MYVTVNHVVYNSEDAIKFISRFQEVEVVEATVEKCYRATGSAYYNIEVRIVTIDVEPIECGDHVYSAGESYPKDLLVSCHGHE